MKMSNQQDEGVHQGLVLSRKMKDAGAQMQDAGFQSAG
jgi:hypothetical protein